MEADEFIKGLPRPCPPAAANVRTVETVDALKKLSNTFAYVIANATTYFVSSAHEPMVIASQPLFIDGYDYQSNPRRLRSQVVFDFRSNLEIVFDNRGKYRLIEMKEEN